MRDLEITGNPQKIELPPGRRRRQMIPIERIEEFAKEDRAGRTNEIEPKIDLVLGPREFGSDRKRQGARSLREARVF